MSGKGFDDLPNELLRDIVHYVPDQDLPILRLTCKALYSATDRFASVYFSRRVYRFSPSSLRALHTVTLHPALAIHIKEITFELTGLDRSDHRSVVFKRALENLRDLGNKISVGVRRRSLPGISEQVAESNIPPLFTNVVETFLNTPIPLQAIMVDFNPSGTRLVDRTICRNFVEGSEAEPFDLIGCHLEKGLDVVVRYYPTPLMFEEHSQTKFATHDRSLDASFICLDHAYGLKQAMSVMPFSEIRLFYCEIEMRHFTQFTFEHRDTLKIITLDNVHLYGKDYDWSSIQGLDYARWSDVLSSISRLQHIEYCSFRKLWKETSELLLCADDEKLELEGFACIQAGLTELLDKCYSLEDE